MTIIEQIEDSVAKLVMQGQYPKKVILSSEKWIELAKELESMRQPKYGEQSISNKMLIMLTSKTHPSESLQLHTICGVVDVIPSVLVGLEVITRSTT